MHRDGLFWPRQLFFPCTRFCRRLDGLEQHGRPNSHLGKHRVFLNEVMLLYFAGLSYLSGLVSCCRSGIVLSAVDGGEISRCVAYQNGGRNAHLEGGPVGIWVWCVSVCVTLPWLSLCFDPSLVQCVLYGPKFRCVLIRV